MSGARSRQVLKPIASTARPARVLQQAAPTATDRPATSSGAKTVVPLSAALSATAEATAGADETRLIPTSADSPGFGIEPQAKKAPPRWLWWTMLLLALIAGLIALAVLLDDDDDDEPGDEQPSVATSLLAEDTTIASDADSDADSDVDSNADADTSTSATVVGTTLSPGEIADAIGGALRGETAAADPTPAEIAEAIGNALRDQ